mgnify:CR=1 FL=1
MRLLFVLLILFVSIISIESKPRLWTRIPQYFVDDRVSNFLNQNRITNCFEFTETPTNLLLKCWRDNKLTDVSIEILNPQRENYYFPISVSI